MLTNYYTLLHLTKEFKSLIGMKLIECFSQEKDTAIFTFYDGVNFEYIYFSAKPNGAKIYLDHKISRARKNSADLMPDLLGDVLQNVELMPDDRVIHFTFVNFILVFQVFSGASANMFLCDKNFNIKFTLNKKAAPECAIYTPRDTNLPDFNSFLGSEKLLSALSKCDLLLGKHYAQELIRRSDSANVGIIAELTENAKLNLFKYAESLVNELVFAKKYYIIQTDAEPIFSLIKLTAYDKIVFEGKSASEAVKKAGILKIRQSLQKILRTEISAALLKERKRFERKVSDCKYSIESKERAELYNKIGGLLMSLPNLKEKQGESIKLTDYSGEELIVKLNPKLNLIENSQIYFTKAKKTNVDIDVQADRIILYQKKLNDILSLIGSYEKISGYNELKKFHQILINKRIIINMNAENKTPEEKFKRFNLGDGFTLYVGKNAANNDELTMKFAKPNDIWLHARGTSGSHAILPLRNIDKAPKHIIKKAAEITAYYSGARNAKYVPVCYTQKKNVRKPKGANPGAVVITREEVVMVEPKVDVQEETN